MTGSIYVGRHEPDTSHERELDDDSKPLWLCAQPYCERRHNHRGQCCELKDAPIAQWVDCCQHAAYSFTLVGSSRECVCVDCGHQFRVMLGGPDRFGNCDTDGISNWKEAS